MRTTWLIAVKELRSAVRSVRFAVICLIVVPLFIGGIYLGANKFHFLEQAYQSTLRQQSESFGAIKTYAPLRLIRVAAYRPPNALIILGPGVSSLMGDTFFQYNCQNPPAVQTELIHNSFSRLHGEWDLLTVIGWVLSFLALLLSYDALAGEKRDGTIRLLCASSMRRTSLVLGKFLGLTVTLAIPVLLAAVLSALLLSLLLPSHFAVVLPELAALTGMAVLYSAVFLSIGITVSALTGRPFQALIILLACWVLLVIAVPQLLTFAAATTHPALSEKEIDRRYSEVTNVFFNFVMGLGKKHPNDPVGRTNEWFEGTKDYQKDLRRIWTDSGNNLLLQEQTAWVWSWVSPSASLSLSMTTLFGTNPSTEVQALYDVWDSLYEYIDYLKTHYVADLEEALNSGKIPLELRTYPGGIPWSEVPKPAFQAPLSGKRWGAYAAGIVTQCGWLALFLLCSFLLIRRYDPR
jgi:ABC-type transport system involved in multi-copper enzyme maturation permease subunit